MTPQSEEMLTERIRKVEKQNKWLFLFVILSVAVAASLALGLRRASSTTVEAERFILRDGSGKVRGDFSVDSAHFPHLILYGDDAKEVLGLRVGPSGAIISLDYPDSRAQISSNGGAPDLFLADKKNNSTVSIGILEGNPMMFLNRQRADKLLDSVGISTGEDATYLTLNNGTEASMSLSVNDGVPSIALADRQGFSSTFGSADLESGQTGEKRKTSAASIHLFGKNGKVLWSIP